jgi:hypothetical protein
MALPIIRERTDEEVVARSTDRVFGNVRNVSEAISVTYDGKYACFGAVVTDVALTDVQLESLATQIEAISGVHKAFIRIGSCRLPIDRVPEGQELKISVEAGYTITPIPVE